MEDDVNNPIPLMIIIFSIWATLVGLIIYFIRKRAKEKKNENFEKRDN
jgi:heme/copper-type cytochrome/quinol oxidase subunit 2|tara:strand:- start:207 stop:350 length:144 start_codon:yes stop_codon:yes gene_type:complete